MIIEVENMSETEDYEFDLSELFKTLWNGKIIIFLSTAFFLLLGILYTKQKTISYEVTTLLQNGNPSAFIEYKVVNQVLKENKLFFEFNKFVSYKIDTYSIFNLFVNEFKDFEEMISVLSENSYVIQKIKDLDENGKRRALINFAKSFKLIPTADSNEKDLQWTMSFVWHDDVEGKRLFKKALSIVLDNTKKTVIKDINVLANLIDLKSQRDIQAIQTQLDLIEKSQHLRIAKRIQFLKEHSKIAKKINLEKNINYPNTRMRSEPNKLEPSPANALTYEDNIVLGYDYNFDNFPYYLRGHIAIDEEIKIINDRSFDKQLLMASGYVNLKNKLLSLENNLASSQLRDTANIIQKDKMNNWIEYDLEFADSILQFNTRIFLIFCTLLGLIFGSIYVIISKIRKI